MEGQTAHQADLEAGLVGQSNQAQGFGQRILEGHARRPSAPPRPFDAAPFLNLRP
jgi:hypothetical protein